MSNPQFHSYGGVPGHQSQGNKNSNFQNGVGPKSEPSQGMFASQRGAGRRVPTYTPQPQEKSFYDHIWSSIAESESSEVGVQPIKDILDCTDLPQPILSLIWGLSNPFAPTSWRIGNFYSLCRLVSLAQQGLKLTPTVLDETAGQSFPLPRFRGMTPSPNHTIQTGQSPQPSYHSPHGEWSINTTDKAKYDGIFLKRNKDKDGFVTRGDSMALLAKSSLPPTMHDQVFRMADLDQDQRLDNIEFVILMHITVGVSKRGKAMPAHLPPELQALKPMSSRNTTSYVQQQDTLPSVASSGMSFESTGEDKAGSTSHPIDNAFASLDDNASLSSHKESVRTGPASVSSRSGDYPKPTVSSPGSTPVQHYYPESSNVSRENALPKGSRSSASGKAAPEEVTQTPSSTTRSSSSVGDAARAFEDHLHGTLARENAAVRRVQEDTTNMSAELQRLQRERAILERQIATAQQRLAEEQREYDEVMQQITATVDEISRLREKSSSIGNQQIDMSSRLAGEKAKLASLVAELQRLQTSANSANNEASTNEGETMDIMDETHQTDRAADALQAIADEHNRNTDLLSVEIKSLEQAVSAARDGSSLAISRLNTSKQNLQNAKQARESAGQRLTKAQHNVKMEKERREAALSKKEELQKEAQNLIDDNGSDSASDDFNLAEEKVVIESMPYNQFDKSDFKQSAKNSTSKPIETETHDAFLHFDDIEFGGLSASPEGSTFDKNKKVSTANDTANTNDTSDNTFEAFTEPTTADDFHFDESAFDDTAFTSFGNAQPSTEKAPDSENNQSTSSPNSAIDRQTSDNTNKTTEQIDDDAFGQDDTFDQDAAFGENDIAFDNTKTSTSNEKQEEIEWDADFGDSEVAAQASTAAKPSTDIDTFDAGFDDWDGNFDTTDTSEKKPEPTPQSQDFGAFETAFDDAEMSDAAFEGAFDDVEQQATKEVSKPAGDDDWADFM